MQHSWILTVCVSSSLLYHILFTVSTTASFPELKLQSESTSTPPSTSLVPHHIPLPRLRGKWPGRFSTADISKGFQRIYKQVGGVGGRLDTRSNAFKAAFPSEKYTASTFTATQVKYLKASTEHFALLTEYISKGSRPDATWNHFIAVMEGRVLPKASRRKCPPKPRQ